MSKDTEREVRLQQLAQRFLSGEMTDEERQEYDTLQEEQSAERDDAITKLAEKQVKFRLPRFLRRKS